MPNSHQLIVCVCFSIDWWFLPWFRLFFQLNTRIKCQIAKAGRFQDTFHSLRTHISMVSCSLSSRRWCRYEFNVCVVWSRTCVAFYHHKWLWLHTFGFFSLPWVATVAAALLLHYSYLYSVSCIAAGLLRIAEQFVFERRISESCANLHNVFQTIHESKRKPTIYREKKRC